MPSEKERHHGFCDLWHENVNGNEKYQQNKRKQHSKFQSITFSRTHTYIQTHTHSTHKLTFICSRCVRFRWTDDSNACVFYVLRQSINKIVTLHVYFICFWVFCGIYPVSISSTSTWYLTVLSHTNFHLHRFKCAHLQNLPNCVHINGWISGKKHTHKWKFATWFLSFLCQTFGRFRCSLKANKHFNTATRSEFNEERRAYKKSWQQAKKYLSKKKERNRWKKLHRMCTFCI